VVTTRRRFQAELAYLTVKHVRLYYLNTLCVACARAREQINAIPSCILVCHGLWSWPFLYIRNINDTRYLSEGFFVESIELYRQHPDLREIMSNEYGNRNLKSYAYGALVNLCKAMNPNVNRDFVHNKIAITLFFSLSLINMPLSTVTLLLWELDFIDFNMHIHTTLIAWSFFFYHKYYGARRPRWTSG
jgi:hypothetical protein